MGLTTRMYMKRRAGAIFRENPLFGGGPGVIYEKRMNWRTMKMEPMPYMDDSYLYPLSVGGVVGYSLIWLCYIAFVGTSIYAVRRLRHPLHKCLAVVPLAKFAWLLITSPVMWWLVDRFHVAAFAVATGMSMALVYHERIHGSDVPVVDL